MAYERRPGFEICIIRFEIIQIFICIQGDAVPLLNVMAFGWTEDGRCSNFTSKSFPGQESKKIDSTAILEAKLSLTQACPRPVASLRAAPIPIPEDDSKQNKRKNKKQLLLMAESAKQRERKPLFVCKEISAGSRHSLLVMIDCQKYNFVSGQV